MKTRLFAAGLMAGLMGVSGCAKDGAGPAPSTGMNSGVTPATKPVAAPKVMPAKTMTHVLTKQTPYYTSMPTGSAKPAGEMRSGAKVLLVIPGEFAQVETSDGKLIYVSTEALDLAPVATASPTPPDAPAPRPQNATPAPVATTTPPAVQSKLPSEKDMTHVLTKEQPYYKAMPASASPKADGTLPAGEKVLLVIPGDPYCQVGTADGKMVYTAFEGVDLVASK